MSSESAFLPHAVLKHLRSQVPGDLIFAKLWGSHSHNTALPSSDRDYLAVYVCPTTKVLSLDTPVDTVVGTDPDFQAYEVMKFCRLLRKGNPGVVECLFTPRDTHGTPTWDKLLDFGRDFLTQRTLKQYLGYVGGQLRRLQNHAHLHTTGGRYNTKWAYHMIRLLGDARRIAEGRLPQVWKSGAERLELMAIRRGEISQSDIEDLTQIRTKAIEDLKPWPLPEEAPTDRLNEWLLDIRLPGRDLRL